MTGRRADSAALRLRGQDRLGYEQAQRADWKPYVKTYPRYYRPAEVDRLQGDSTKAREKLGWQPKTTFKQQLVRLMVDADMKAITNPGDKVHNEAV